METIKKNTDNTSQSLVGNQNIYQGLAAGISSKLKFLRKESIRERLGGFLQEEHRLERVAFVRGVEYINDSRATNLNSTWYALEYINKPIVWIAGGLDQGNDYESIADLVSKKVKAIICLGIDNGRLLKAFERRVTFIYEARCISDAVKSAYLAATPDDVVLLSPACASFDLFENLEDRGNQFKQAVFNL